MISVYLNLNKKFRANRVRLSVQFRVLRLTKSKKWTQSSEQFAQNVIVEELRHKSQQNTALKKQISEIYGFF